MTNKAVSTADDSIVNLLIFIIIILVRFIIIIVIVVIVMAIYMIAIFVEKSENGIYDIQAIISLSLRFRFRLNVTKKACDSIVNLLLITATISGLML